MKKHMQSVLAALLAAILLLTTLPLSAMANELPMVLFDPETGVITDEAYAAMYDAAEFSNGYFYGGFDGYWQTYVVQAAYGDEEANAMVQEEGGTYFILAEEPLLQMVFSEFFPAPLDFLDEYVLPALKAGEGMGVIPAYNAETGAYLVKAISLEEQWNNGYLYHGFIDNHDGTGSFYFAEITGEEGGTPVPGANGTRITLRPTEQGVELVSCELAEPLPETVDRSDEPGPEPGPEPRPFDYEWGYQTADFLEDYREECLKQNIARILYDCAVFKEQYETLADGVATLTLDQLVRVYDECFGHCSPFDPEIHKEYFDGTFVMDVAAGNIPGITYQTDFGAPENDRFTLENGEPVNDTPRYQYKGWIENENRDGGSYYFAKVTGADPGTHELTFGEGGIRVDLLVIDGRMTEMAYDYIDALPENFDPEPEGPRPFDYWWACDAALFLEGYVDEFTKSTMASGIFEDAQYNLDLEPQNGAITLTREQFRELFSRRFYAAPDGYYEEVVLPDIENGAVAGLTFDGQTETFTVRGDQGSAAVTRFTYVGWIEGEDHNSGSFYFAEITGWTEEWDPVTGEKGVRIDLHVEDGRMICDAYEYVDALPESFDPVPVDPDERSEFDVAMFVEEYFEEYLRDALCGEIIRWYEEVMPDKVVNDTVTISAQDFAAAVTCVWGNMPVNFLEEHVLPEARGDDLNGVTYDEGTDSYTVENGGGEGERSYCYVGWTNEEEGCDAFWFFRVDGVNEQGWPKPNEDGSGYRVLLRPAGGDFELVEYGTVESLPEHFNDDPGSGEFDYASERRVADFVEEYYYEIDGLFLISRVLKQIEKDDPSYTFGDLVTLSAQELAALCGRIYQDAPVGFIENAIIPDAKTDRYNYLPDHISYDESTNSFSLWSDGGGWGDVPNYYYSGWTHEEGCDIFWFGAVGNWSPAPGVKVVLRPAGGDFELVEYGTVDALPEHYNDSPDDPGPGPDGFYVPQDPYNPDLYESGDWNYDVVDDKVIIIRYLNETETDVVIPAEIDGKPVVGVANRAFLYRSNMTSVSIPASVTDIQHDAFFGCSGLQSVTLDPANTENRLVEGCLINNRDVLVAAVKGTSDLPVARHIGDGALSALEGFVFVPEGVEDLGNYAFAGSAVNQVVLSDGVTRIGDCAFDNCESLEEIYYNGSPEDWNAMEKGAGNEELENVTFIEKRFIGENVSIIAPNGVAPRGTALVNDLMGELSGDVLGDLDGLETGSVWGVRALLDLDHQPLAIDGMVTVGIPVPRHLQGKYLAAVYLPETGDPFILEGTTTDDDYFLFETPVLGEFALVEPTLLGVAEQKGLPGTVIEAGGTIRIPERQSVLLSFRQMYREFDLVAGWRNDLLTDQGFDCPANPVIENGETFARIGAGDLEAGSTGTLTVSWYKYDDIFGPRAVGWKDAVPVYTCTFTVEVTENPYWIEANIYGKNGGVTPGDTIRIEEGKEIDVYFALWDYDEDYCFITADDALKDAGFTVGDEPVFHPFFDQENMPYVRLGAGDLKAGDSGEITVFWVRYADAFGDEPVPEEELEYLATATFRVEVVPEHEFGEPSYEWEFISVADGGYIFYDTLQAAEEVPAEAIHVGITAHRTCACGEEDWEGGELQSEEVTKYPTCTAKGETTYTFTFANEAFTTQSVTLANIPMLEAAEVEETAEGKTVSFIRQGGKAINFTMKDAVGALVDASIVITDKDGNPIAITADDYTYEDGVFTLKESFLKNLEDGKYTITFQVGDKGVNEEFTVIAFLWGDANGDGVINNKDIVRLKNYLANYDDQTGISQNGNTVYTLADGADANGDGPVNNKDIVRLKNYLVNFDESTNQSSEILGPAN
ncbi:MAG: leucine-rich repeat protein [Clostridia bacterium]|nr:leucine-rich repeat protein [Clostridia bacterium]